MHICKRSSIQIGEMRNTNASLKCHLFKQKKSMWPGFWSQTNQFKGIKDLFCCCCEALVPQHEESRSVSVSNLWHLNFPIQNPMCFHSFVAYIFLQKYSYQLFFFKFSLCNPELPCTFYVTDQHRVVDNCKFQRKMCDFQKFYKWKFLKCDMNLCSVNFWVKNIVQKSFATHLEKDFCPLLTAKYLKLSQNWMESIYEFSNLATDSQLDLSLYFFSLFQVPGFLNPASTEKNPNIMMLPPSCFNVGIVCSVMCIVLSQPQIAVSM